MLLTASGARIRGGNIHPPGTSPPHKRLWVDWDWEGRVKQQVDLLASKGGNCVRVIGDVVGVLDGSITLATYRARWRQLIDYAASVGVSTYACGGNAAHFGAYTVSDVLSVLTGLAAEINGDTDVVGFDIVQESPTWVATNGASAVAAVRAVCDRPLTFSLAKTSQAAMTNESHAGVRDLVDFLDFHVYFSPTAAMWATVAPNESKPILVGEFGLGVSSGQAAQEARYNAVVTAYAAAADDMVAGLLVWAIADDEWGMWPTAGTERSYLTGIFQTIPIGT